MKSLLYTSIMLLPFWMIAQKSYSYKSNNEITYHVGDTLKLNPELNYKEGYYHIVKGGYFGAMDVKNEPLKSFKKGSFWIIKKMKQKEGEFDGRTYFVISNPEVVANYKVDIEKAIAANEVLTVSTGSNQ